MTATSSSASSPALLSLRLGLSFLLLAALLQPVSAWAQAAPPAKAAEKAAPKPVAEAPAPRVSLKTSLGTIVLELNPTAAPQSTQNFLQYVRDGFYAGTVFHRVMRGFMIQGGGMDASLQQKRTREPIALESRNGLKNVRGSLAMARTSDPNSATSQFFINVVDNPMLDAPSPDGFGYAVFGRVVQGMEVVDKIRDVPVTNVGMYQNVPVSPVVIEAATVAK